MAVRIHEDGIPEIKIKRRIIRGWVKEEILRRNKQPGDINIVLTTDENLRKLNREHLSRDYFTDVITFDYSINNVITGEVYISAERVRENAGIYGTSFNSELFRIIIHGILHMLGYKDDDRTVKSIMTDAEDEAIGRLMNILSGGQQK